MRIQELQLLAYGPFTDSVLDFSKGSEGFHLVYGPNEAGKSSALRAIHGLLFGIPTQCRDDQLHRKRQLRVGAVLQNSKHDELWFHRRKGNKDTLLNPQNRQNVPFANDVLAPFLRGIDADTFARVFGISHDELQRGGEQMQALRGLVGESLFAATVGGSGLAQLLSDLDTQAIDIYASRKSTARIKKAKKEYEAIRKERRELQLNEPRWTRLRKGLESAIQRRDEIVSRSSGLEGELDHLRRLSSAMSWVTKRNELLAQKATFGDSVVSLPDHYSVEERSAKQTELRQLVDEIASLRAKIDGEQSLTHQIAQITIPSGLLGLGDAVNELKDQRAVIVKAARDREALQRESSQIRLQVESLMEDLRLGPSVDDAEKYRISPEQRSHIQSLGTDEKRLRDRPAEIQTEIQSSQARLEQLEQQRDDFGDPLDVGELNRTVTRLQKLGDLQGDLESLNATIDRHERDLQNGLATVGQWSGPRETLASLPVPMPETIDRYADTFADFDQRRELHEQTVRRIGDEIGEARQSIAALQSAGQVPNEADLIEIRTERDAKWRDLRQRAEQGELGRETANPKMRDTAEPDSTGTTPSTELLSSERAGHVAWSVDADAYNSLVGRSDDVADRLRREADRVAQLASHTARIERLTTQRREANEQLDRISNDRADWMKKWQNEWRPAGIAAPLSPREMQSWLTQFKELRSASRDLEHHRADQAKLVQRYETSRDEVRAQLERLPLSSQQAVPQGATLPQLLDQAARLIEQQQAVARDHAEIESGIRHCRAEIDRLTVEHDQATKALAHWQDQWSEATLVLGCDNTLTADQANVRLEHLTNLFQFVREIESKKKRIADIDQDSQRFDEAVRALADRFLPDPGLPSPEIVLMLAEQLETARRDVQRLRQLEAEAENVQQSLDKATARQKTLHQDLAEMCRIAGAPDVDSLPMKEKEANRLADCQHRLDDVHEQLHQLSGNTSVEAFVKAASEWDAGELHAKITQLQREVEELKSDRDDAVGTVRELERELRAADGRGEAADKDQNGVGLIARMQRDAGRYMRLRLAATLLRQQVEKHRAENEDPLLQRASGLFRRMTCQEFTGIRTDFENDDPILVGVRKSGQQVVPVAAMSTGTRDQLYLALRLAYVERQLNEHEPMPFIVDDILIQFDPDRSRATMNVLAELSSRTQVIFFTHHQHLVDLAKESLPSDVCFIHHLDSRERASSV